MKNYMKLKNYNILEILLILSPIFDILNSVIKKEITSDISIGIVVRGMFLAFLIVYMLFKSNYKYKKISIIYLICIFVYIIAFIANIYFNKGINFEKYEFSELIKAFYFPICIVALLNYIETEKYYIDTKLLFGVGIGYITLLFIPFILRIGYGSYTGERVGYIGFFYAANEISSIYAILFTFIIFSYEKIKNKVIYFGIVIYCLYTIMQMGTKIPAIGAIVSIFAFAIIKMIQNADKGKKVYLKFPAIGLVLTIICLTMIVFSPIYENFDIYKKYLISTRSDTIPVIEENIEVKKENNLNPSEKIEESNIEQNEVIGENTKAIEENTIEDEAIIKNNNSIQENTNEENLTGDELATIIHSGRINEKNRIKRIFTNSSIVNKILGLGKINVKDNSYNLSEIDYYDILFNFGYLGFLIYFIPVIVLCYFILKRIHLVKIKKIIKEDKICSYIISILIAFSMCAISGHTLVAPAVSIFIAIILLGTNQELKKAEGKE